MKVERTETIEYRPTPKELAEAIRDLYDHEQCELLNYLGCISEPHKIAMQLQAMEDAEMIDGNGKYLCEQLANYLGNR